MKNLLVLVFLAVLTGCQSTETTYSTPFETVEPSPPYLTAIKYRELIEKCWIGNSTFSNTAMRIDISPTAGALDINAKWLSIGVVPRYVDPTFIGSPVIRIIIEEQNNTTGNSSLLKSSTVKVETYPNTEPGFQYYWLDVKRWSEGDTECLPSNIGQ